MNCFFTVMECTFIKGFRFKKSLDLLVKAPRKIVYDYKKLKLVYCKTGHLYLNSCEIPQRHQEANCFHCGEQNHTNKR